MPARSSISKDALLLSKEGSSKGGIARAESLSSKSLIQIAKKAANKRWQKRKSVY